MTRDPRIDPKAGDVIAWRDLTFEILSTIQNSVLTYRCKDSMGWLTPTCCSVDRFRMWAKDGKIVKVTE